MIYLDSAATAPVRREVLEAMWPYLTGDFGNPSSHHEIGESAARALEWARERVARSGGLRNSEVIFTSGGTEADNLAIKGIALARPAGRHLVTSPIEHEAVLESCDFLRRHHGFEVTTVGVDSTGLVDADEVDAALRDDTTLVTIMAANNEIGVIQPIAGIVQRAHDRKIPVHSDAIQAAPWLPLASLGADAASISGHKLGAPKGIGALLIRGRIPLEPLLHGGGQERGRRSGTENVAGAVGLATALSLQPDAETIARVSELRDSFIEQVLDAVPAALLTGPRPGLGRGEGIERLPSNASFCFPGTSGESILLELGRSGIVCSAGSACAVGSDDPSHVLLSMGIEPSIAATAVRFTFDESIDAGMVSEVAAEVGRAWDSVRSLAR